MKPSAILRRSAELRRGVAALLLATVACGTDVASQAGVTDVVGDSAADDLDSNDVQGDTNGADQGPGSDDEATSDIRIEDLGAVDAEALPDTTVEPDAVPDTDVDPPDGGVTGECCSPEVACPLGVGCYGGTDGICLTPPGFGLCWTESDCGPGDDCIGESVPGCGEPAFRGTCVPTADGCCAELWEFEECGSGYCKSGFCVPALAPGQCITDGDCLLPGYACVGASEAPSSCEEGGTTPPVVGTCSPSGPGGLCAPSFPTTFGECGDELGWAWTGHQCALVYGCFDSPGALTVPTVTEADCEAACAPPICCANDAECPASASVCHDGHCIAPLTADQCWTDADCNDGALCFDAASCPCGDPTCLSACVPGEPCTTLAIGTCIVPPSCCMSSSECEAGQRCVGPGWTEGTCTSLEFLDGQCWNGSDCGPTEQCTGAWACPCFDPLCSPTPGQCTPLPDDCCKAGGACSGGLVCPAIAPETPLAPAGSDVASCVAPAAAGAFWRDDDCEETEFCVGEYIPSCPSSPSTGFCTPKQGACCGSDADCAGGFVCAYAANGKRACVPTPEPGSCFDVTDCESGDVCLGPSLCGCDVTCAVEASTCEPAVALPPGTCCGSNSDCGTGQCTAWPSPPEWAPPGVALGQCVEPVEPGECMTLADCGPNEVCSGFNGHPCGALLPVTTGTCVPANGVCCDGPADCPSALECVKLDGPEYGGTCKPIPTPGSCWSDADCSGGACLGASFCACGCEEQNDQLGTCAGP